VASKTKSEAIIAVLLHIRYAALFGKCLATFRHIVEPRLQSQADQYG